MEQWFSIQGNFPPEDSWHCLEMIFGHDNWFATGMQQVEARDVLKHPTVPMTATPPENYLAQIFIRARLRNPSIDFMEPCTLQSAGRLTTEPNRLGQYRFLKLAYSDNVEVISTQ